MFEKDDLFYDRKQNNYWKNREEQVSYTQTNIFSSTIISITDHKKSVSHLQ